MLCMVLAMLGTVSNAFFNPKFPQAGGLELYINYDTIYNLLNGKFFPNHGFDWLTGKTLDINFKFD